VREKPFIREAIREVNLHLFHHLASVQVEKQQIDPDSRSTILLLYYSHILT